LLDRAEIISQVNVARGANSGEYFHKFKIEKSK